MNILRRMWVRWLEIDLAMRQGREAMSITPKLRARLNPPGFRRN